MDKDVTREPDLDTEILDAASDLTVTDLPDEMSAVAERCGMRDAVLLLCKLPGVPLYIPMSGKEDMIREQVRDNYTGRNALSLAVKLRVDAGKIKKVAKAVSKDGAEGRRLNTYMAIVAEYCGRDVAMRLMEHFPHTVLYVPRGGYVTLQKHFVARRFDGTNTVRLAAKLRVSEMFVRKAVQDMYRQRKGAEADPYVRLRRIADRTGTVSINDIRAAVNGESAVVEMRNRLSRDGILVQESLL